MKILYNKYYNWTSRNQKSILFSLLVFNFLLFLFTRYVFYSTALLPGITKDSVGYYEPVMQLNNGNFPLFNLRTPGYPAFLYLLDIFHLSNHSIFLIQSILTLLATSLLMSRFRGYPLLCITLLFLGNSGVFISFETSILPMSIFASAIMISIVFIYDFFYSKTEGSKPLIFFTLLAFIIIMIRPQGLFTIPVLLFLLWFIFIKRGRKKQGYLFVVLNLLLYSSVAFYNYSTIGSFTLLPNEFKPVAQVGNNIFNLSYPENADPDIKAIVNEINTGFTPEERDIIKNSWNYSSLKKVFTIDNYDKCWRFFNIVNTKPDEVKKVINHSSKSSFKTKIKISYFTILNYIDLSCNYSLFFINSFNNRSYYFCDTKELISLGDKNTSAVVVKEYSVLTDTTVSPIVKDAACAGYRDNFNNNSTSVLFKLACLWDWLSNRLLFSFLWVVLFGLAIGVWLYCVIIKGCLTNKEVLIGSVVLVFFVGNIVLLCLSIFPMTAYIFPLAVCSYIFTFVIISSYIHDRFAKHA